MGRPMRLNDVRKIKKTIEYLESNCSYCIPRTYNYEEILKKLAPFLMSVDSRIYKYIDYDRLDKEASEVLYDTQAILDLISFFKEIHEHICLLLGDVPCDSAYTQYLKQLSEVYNILKMLWEINKPIYI